MNLFMVVEHYPSGPAPVYARYAERGRMLPDGVEFVDSWVDDAPEPSRCYQLMRAASVAELQVWMDRWADIIDFECVPVVDSATAAERTRQQAAQ